VIQKLISVHVCLQNQTSVCTTLVETRQHTPQTATHQGSILPSVCCTLHLWSSPATRHLTRNSTSKYPLHTEL